MRPALRNVRSTTYLNQSQYIFARRLLNWVTKLEFYRLANNNVTETPRCIVPEHQTLPRPRPASCAGSTKKQESNYSNDYPNIRLFSNIQGKTINYDYHYDILLFFTLKKRDFRVIRKFRNILKLTFSENIDNCQFRANARATANRSR